MYLKSQVAELHSNSRWRQNRRQVREGETAYKSVPCHFDSSKVTCLFGEWQTQPVQLEMLDGQLPRNQYGNYEMWDTHIPEGCVYLDLPGIHRLARKHQVDAVQVMRGFERHSSRFTPLIQGVILREGDRQSLLDLHEIHKE